TYVVDLSGAKAPRPITPEGTAAGCPSPDGKYVAGTGAPDKDSTRKLTLFPVAGGEPIELPAPDPAYLLIQWSPDSKALYVYRAGELPLMVYRLDIASAKMSPVRELTTADRAGVVSIGPVVSNLSASQFAYSYYQTLSVMYVISGLR